MGQKRQQITIWTDGSCTTKGNRCGGLGVYIQIGKDEFTYRKGYINTTTARMEMRALLNAINMVDTNIPTDVTVYCDSQFIVHSFKCGWLSQWRLKNFVGVKNSDLWKEIIVAISQHPHMKFNIIWVRGHQHNIEDSIIFGNNVADALADYKTQVSYIEDVPN